MENTTANDLTSIVVPRVVSRPALSKNAKFDSCEVYSNHYNFTLGKSGKIHQWDVQFEPPLEKDSREVKNDIFIANRKEIIKKVGLFIRTGDIVFTFQKSDLKESTIRFELHKKYVIILKDINKQISFSNIDAPDDSKLQVFKVINSGIKQIMKNLGYTEFGYSRKFYDLKKKQELHEGDFVLDVKSGYFTSIDLYQNNVPKIMIDCSSRIIRVYSMWEEFEFFRATMDEKEIEDTYILGRRFMASYGNNRVYYIDGIDRKLTPKSPFPDQNKAATFQEYFKKQYGVAIQNLTQFLVYSVKEIKENKNGVIETREEKIYLVPELLKPTGLTDQLRQDRNAMQDVAKYTKLFPSVRMERQDNLIKIMNSLDSSKNEIGLQIDAKSNKQAGKLLKFPEIKLAKPMIPDRGNFIIKMPIFEQNANLKNWVVVFNSKDSDMAMDFAKKLNEASKSLGIKVDKPTMVGITPGKDAKGNIRDDEIIAALKKEAGAKIAMIFLPKQNADRVYKKVKTQCNQIIGIPTQFFSNWSFKFTKNLENLSVASKVLIQMCAKLKMKIWKVAIPQGINENGHQVMIVGADVFHKSMHESVTSVVSSYDKDFCSYYSQTSVQRRKGDDTLYDIAEKVKLAARRYVKANGHPPNIIIVYRDGVGQGQVESVREKELKSLLKGIEQEFNGKTPSLAYIIVTKRLSDRFFINNRGQIDNPEGGLIIDSGVVKHNTFDYFMVAQAVTQGTATPTNYNVIYNNTPLTADQFYQLTYHQCFSYYNWSGPLKVPAVIMMANKQGLVIGNNHGKENRETMECLKDAPFYL